MKKICIGLFAFISFSQAFAASCIDLQTNVNRYQETSSVKLVQGFLFEKGFLKTSPNGYFGAGTFSAMKAYQKSVGIAQTGNVGPLTRFQIRNTTCTALEQKTSTSTSVSKLKPVPAPVATSTIVQPKSTSSPVVAQPSPVASSSSSLIPQSSSTLTSISLRNEQRKSDIDKILLALADQFNQSQHLPETVIPVNDFPVEICVSPSFITGVAVGSNTATVSPSPCHNFINISNLSPKYLATIPRDPSLPTTSVLTGYMISRNNYGDITVSAKNPENMAIIRVSCKFPFEESACRHVEHTSSATYEAPNISSIDMWGLLEASPSTVPLFFKGKNFTTANAVTFTSLSSNKKYTIGTFPSSNGTLLTIKLTDLDKSFPCGNGCNEKLPLGTYNVTITNQGGTSNVTAFALKGFTASAVSAQGNAPLVPKTKNVHLGTFYFSSDAPLLVKELVLQATSTSNNLPSKITNFVLKDVEKGTVLSSSSPNFSFESQAFPADKPKIYETYLASLLVPSNHSKTYELYADIGDVLASEAGRITYGGYFSVRDASTTEEMTLPIKEMTFSVSY